METGIKWYHVLVGTVVISLVGFLLWCLFWVSSIDNYELGFVYNRVTGQIEKVEHPGWVVRTPFKYSVHSIDLRPYQIQIAANQRVLNAKLVRFNPDGLDTFVEWHGRGAGDNTAALLEILKCYAFDRAEGKDCPFLTVLSELSLPQAFADKKVVGDEEAIH